MQKQKFDEIVSHFNKKVSEMEIETKYKMELLGMVTALGYAHEKETHEERTETHACDCISRQMLLEYIHGEPVGRLLCDKYNLDGLIEQFPSAQPERKKGKWVPVTNGRGGFECDQCHNYAPSYQNGVEWLSGFCPNCGADMRGEQDG